MDMQLEAKRALVTGSSGGIGEAIAEALAAEGASTAVHGCEAAAVARVVDEIRGADGTAIATVCDLTDADAAKAVHADVLAALGGLDILVNDVGLYEPTSWEDTDADQWRTTYEANVVTTVRRGGDRGGRTARLAAQLHRSARPPRRRRARSAARVRRPQR